MDREHCALLSRELGEDLGGSAPEARGWIAMEHPGPWERDVASTPGLGTVAGHLAVPGVRLQLIRPVRHQHVTLPQPGGHTVLLAHGATDPAGRWTERLVVPDLDSLAGLDPTVVLRPVPPGLGAPVTHDVWLVCTHARRDACCALHGRPVAAALDAAGTEVWETTHTGGHRFAATAIVLPDGLSLGRLDTVDPVEVAADLARGVLPAALLRGRCAAPRAAQAAEVALRRRLGRSGRDAVLPLGVTDGAVTLRTPDGTWSATVDRTPASPPRPVSDGAEPSRPATWTVSRLART